MQGTILVLDGVSTNRIMLKVQLTAAWYHVVQADRLDGLPALLRRTRPDLVLTAMTLPDGSATEVKQALQADESLSDVPVVAIAASKDKSIRLRALEAGLDDVLVQPFNDTLLLARIRSFLRARASIEELRPADGAPDIGFAEPAVTPIAPPPVASIVLLTQTAETGRLWHSALEASTRHHLRHCRLGNIQPLLSPPVPDAIVVELSEAGLGLNLLADLRARSATRHTALVAVIASGNPDLASEALDRGADTVVLDGFDAKELSLRLDAQIIRKTHGDRIRASVRKGLAAAMTDSLTGLHNRRYALPALNRIAREAAQNGNPFALMLADLDHFKKINDRFGHAAGDLVLVETARRLREYLRPDDLLARVGGEEFLIALPDTGRGMALHLASRMCRKLFRNGFTLPGQTRPVQISMSVGLQICDPAHVGSTHVDDLINQADRALYAAKGAGRNRVWITRNAA